MAGGQSSPGTRQPPHTSMVVAVFSSLETNHRLTTDWERTPPSSSNMFTSNFRKWNRRRLWTPHLLPLTHTGQVFLSALGVRLTWWVLWKDIKWLLYDSASGKTYTYRGHSWGQFQQGKKNACMWCVRVMEKAIKVQGGQGQRGELGQWTLVSMYRKVSKHIQCQIKSVWCAPSIQDIISDFVRACARSSWYLESGRPTVRC